MNTIFKYNANAKYSTKDIQGCYNGNNFSLLDVHVDEKGKSVKLSYQRSLEIITLQQNQNLQQLVMNGHYLWPSGENVIIAMVNASLN